MAVSCGAPLAPLHEGCIEYLYSLYMEMHAYLLKCLEHLDAVGEHSVCQQERVEEVNRQETQICQPFKESFWAGIADLREFAGVQGSTKADVNVILE